MQFLNHLMLWGALAVGIPIVLHFWHQKKGKLLNWAATQWLTEKDLQQSKGIRLDNILLLIVRCLLLVLLAVLLAKPLLEWLNGNESYQKIHIVQANSLVVNNYKFELEEALKKGEKVYWINDKIIPVENLSNLIFAPPLGSDPRRAGGLQTCINKVNELNRQFGKMKYELYLVNNQSLNQVSNIFVPSKFSVHSIIDSTQKWPKPYLELSDKRKLFVNADNQLATATTLPLNEKFEVQPVHKGALNVLLENVDKTEKQTVIAALKALNQVYQLEFSIDEQLNTKKKYDWIFTNKATLPGVNTISEKTHQIPFSEIKERGSSGQLPEFLGELIVKQFGLYPKQAPLSQQQLQSIFKTETGDEKSQNDELWLPKSILLFFILLLAIERWLSIQKNA